MPVTRIKTDEEIVQEAARALYWAQPGEEYETACFDMVEALRYARSVQWWAQFDDPQPLKAVS